MVPKPPESDQVARLAGRPLKRGGREKISLYIEKDTLAKLDALAAKRELSRSDAVNLTLDTADGSGIIDRLLDGT